MLVKDIMQSVKIHTISQEATVREAATIMAELKIGALIVGNPQKIDGIFSERDILKKVIGAGLPYESTKVKEVMSTNITVVDEIEMAHTALMVMQEKKFRHLPVLNEKGICIGMVGIRDLMKSISETLEKENNGLARHITEDKNWN